MSAVARATRCLAVLGAATLVACSNGGGLPDATSGGGGGASTFAIVVTPEPASVNAGAQQVFTATLQDAPGHIHVEDVQWTLSGASCVGTACGMLSGGSGATVTYTAPMIAPAPDAHVTVTASAGGGVAAGGLAGGGVTAAVTFPTAADAGNDAALNGDYVFRFFGFDLPPQHYSNVSHDTGGIGIVGRFHADGAGHLSAIELDADYTSAGPEHHANQTGSYRIDAQRRGTMVLATGTTTSLTLRFVVSPSTGNGRMIEFDSTLGAGRVGSGEFRKQVPGDLSLAAFHGDFAYGLAGEIPGEPPSSRLAIAGRFTTDAAGALGRAIAEPSFGAATVIRPTTLAPIDAATGRGTMTWDMPNLAISFGMTSRFAFYVIDAEHAFLISTDARRPGGANDMGQAFLVGEARAQHLPPGMPSLSGAAIYYTSGAALVQTPPTVAYVPVPTAGQLVFSAGANGSGTIDSGRLDQVANGTWTPYTVSAGTYGVSAAASDTGRARLQFLLDGRSVVATIYLSGFNEGFVVGRTLGSSNAGEAGFLEPQLGVPSGVEGDYVGASVLPGLGSAPNAAFTLRMSNGLATGLVDVSSTAGLSSDGGYDGTYSPGLSAIGRYDVILSPTGPALHGDFVAWHLQRGKLLLLPIMNNGGAPPVIYIADQ